MPSFKATSVPILFFLLSLPAAAESLFITGACPDDYRTCAKVRLGDSERAATWSNILTLNTSIRYDGRLTRQNWSTADRVFGFDCAQNTVYATDSGCEFYFRSQASPVLAASSGPQNSVRVLPGLIEATLHSPSDVADLSRRLPYGEMTAHSLAIEGGTERELSLRCSATQCTVTYRDPSILGPNALVNFRHWPEVQ